MENIKWCVNELDVINGKQECSEDATFQKIVAAREELATMNYTNPNLSCRHCIHAKVCTVHTMSIEMVEFNRDGYFSKDFEDSVTKIQAIGSTCDNFIFNSGQGGKDEKV